MKSYYTMSEFKQMSLDEMKQILNNSLKKDYQAIKSGLQTHIQKDEEIDDEMIEKYYIVNQFYKYISDGVKYFDYSLVAGLYYIYVYSKNHKKNIFDVIIDYYIALGKNICLTKTSDIISLLLQIKQLLVTG